MSELHAAGWFLALGTAFMIIAIVFAVIVIRSVYNRIDTLKDVVNKADLDMRETRYEMQAIAKAYSAQSEENHAVLMSISTRLSNIEKEIGNAGK